MEGTVKFLEEVAKEIERLSLKRETHLKATHGRFNLFTVLLNQNDEDCLHTRYLTHLLDPNGTHDCKRLFLNNFLDTVGLTGEGFDVCLVVVNQHYTGGLGNIDIYIEFEKAILVIENKIEAGDQERQLERYYLYSNKKNKKVYLFYLTLDGHNPSDVSAGNLKKADSVGTLGDNNYFCISYRNHILKWLEKCCQKTYSFVNINQALQQYRNVVNQLLGNSLETQDMEKIKEMLKNNPQIMSQLNQLQNALTSIKQDTENDVQAQCQEILGRRASKIQYEGDKLALYQFFDDSWGPAATTDLTLLMDTNGNYALRACDIQSGSIWDVVKSLSSETWKSEKRYYYLDFCHSKDLSTVLKELKKIINMLNESK